VRTLEERIDWVIQHRGFSSLRDLTLRAGLSHSTLHNAMQRERRSGSTDLKVSSVLTLAEHAGVSPGWLAFGEGTPEPRTPERLGLELAELTVRKLAERGFSRARAEEVVGALLVRHGIEMATLLDVFLAAEATLTAEREHANSPAAHGAHRVRRA
jgi:lambda repressor-like predicted transcriptional regulator